LGSGVLPFPRYSSKGGGEGVDLLGHCRGGKNRSFFHQADRINMLAVMGEREEGLADERNRKGAFASR